MNMKKVKLNDLENINTQLHDLRDILEEISKSMIRKNIFHVVITIDMERLDDLSARWNYFIEHFSPTIFVDGKDRFDKLIDDTYAYLDNPSYINNLCLTKYDITIETHKKFKTRLHEIYRSLKAFR